MSEVSFEQLLNEEGSLNQIRTGAVVKGTVIGVKENEISLNIGYKADGIVTKNEYTNDSSADLTQLVHVGDEMEVKVLKVNDGEGQVALSYKSNLAFAIIHLQYLNLHLIANMNQLGQICGRIIGVLVLGNDTISLVANVQADLVFLHADNGALNNCSCTYLV